MIKSNNTLIQWPSAQAPQSRGTGDGSWFAYRVSMVLFYKPSMTEGVDAATNNNRRYIRHKVALVKEETKVMGVLIDSVGCAEWVAKTNTPSALVGRDGRWQHRMSGSMPGFLRPRTRAATNTSAKIQIWSSQ